MPSYASKGSLEKREIGYREDTNKEVTAMDHLETQSDAAISQNPSQLNEGEATDNQLISEKHRLEEVVARLNMELKNKNEKILELLEHIEDLRVTVQVREKAYSNL